MKHFPLTQWVDFVRGVSEATSTAAMERHLTPGCPACEQTVRRLRAVSELARVDEGYEPPAHLIRFAKAAFSLRRPDRVFLLGILPARLAFEGMDRALLAGTRGPGEEFNRQNLYEAGDFSLHLRFERAQGVATVSLTGQIANRNKPEAPIAHVPVLLTRGRTVVARSLSNEFGEFQVEYRANAALRLQIPIFDAGQRINLALDCRSGQGSESRYGRRRRRRAVRPT